MSNLEETAYPRLRDDIAAQELDQLLSAKVNLLPLSK